MIERISQDDQSKMIILMLDNIKGRRINEWKPFFDYLRKKYNIKKGYGVKATTGEIQKIEAVY